MNKFKDEVKNTPGGANALNCFLCGSCTAGCPVNEMDDGYNPREIMRLILLDMEEDLLRSDEIWKCSQCHVCVAHCPQDVRFADIVRALREIAVDKGYRDRALGEKIKTLDEALKRERLEKIGEALKSSEKAGEVLK